jgi:hypothetical protein
MKKLFKVLFLLGIIVGFTSIYSFTNKTPLPTVFDVAITVTDNSQFECDRKVTLVVEINGMSVYYSQDYDSGTPTYYFHNIPVGCDNISSGMSKKCSQGEIVIGQSRNGPFTAYTSEILYVGIGS